MNKCIVTYNPYRIRMYGLIPKKKTFTSDHVTYTYGYVHYYSANSQYSSTRQILWNLKIDFLFIKQWERKTNINRSINFNNRTTMYGYSNLFCNYYNNTQQPGSQIELVNKYTIGVQFNAVIYCGPKWYKRANCAVVPCMIFPLFLLLFFSTDKQKHAYTYNTLAQTNTHNLMKNILNYWLQRYCIMSTLLFLTNGGKLKYYFE